MKRLARLLLGLGATALVLNEVRGAIMAAPLLLALIHEGGTPMAVLVASCSLLGIALSVIVPLWLARRLRRVL